MNEQAILKNPWMDFASYGIKDASRFKGREEEIKKFLRIIDSGTMSVLYANSGIGKTSFLNAGISPVYQKMGYFPIHIVFPDEMFALKDIEPWLLQRLKDAFTKQDGDSNDNERYVWDSTIANEIEKCKDSLWWNLHTKVMKDLQTGEIFFPLIVFDQFEEIFTKSKKYGSSDLVKNFFELVGHLASTSLPGEIEEELERQDTKGNYVEIDSEHHYKVIFSLRKEYLSDFDYWTNDVNSISELHQNRMFLLPLKREQALKVITEQPVEDNSTECYTTLNKVSYKILDLIDPRKKNEIEPFMLSALCSKLYNKAIADNKEQLESSDVESNISNIILEIYEEKVHVVFHDTDHLRRFEQTLVDEDGHRNRPKIKELDDIRFKEVYQKRLEDAHLIRIDTYDDDAYVELIHDLLAKAINKKREEEEQESRIAELENSKKRQKYIYGGIVGILIVVLVGGLYWLMSLPDKEGYNSNSLYHICLKAKVLENKDEKKSFGPDDYWDVNLLFWTANENGDSLRLTHPIDPSQCNFHKGGVGTDLLMLTFTKQEIDSLKEIFVEVRPKSTLCMNHSFPINLIGHCNDPNKVDTIAVSITKNIEETDTYEGIVYADLENSIEPLNEALIVIAGRTTYSDTTGHYALSIPRGNALFNHIYIIKQGYCFVDTPLVDNITINLKRDTTVNFVDRFDKIKELWDIAYVTSRTINPTPQEREILKKFQIDKKENLRRGKNVHDSLLFVYFDSGMDLSSIEKEGSKNRAKVGDVRNVIGTYQDKKKRKYIFEGFMTLENRDSFQWLLDITQYDMNFNTRKKKATLIHADNSAKTKIIFDR